MSEHPKQENSAFQKHSRRDFLKLAGLFAGGAALAGTLAAQVLPDAKPGTVDAPSIAQGRRADTPEVELDAVDVIKQLLPYGSLLSYVPEDNIRVVSGHGRLHSMPDVLYETLAEEHRGAARHPDPVQIPPQVRTIELLPFASFVSVTQQCLLRGMSDGRSKELVERLYRFLACDIECAAVGSSQRPEPRSAMADDLSLRARRARFSGWDGLLLAWQYPAHSRAVIGTSKPPLFQGRPISYYRDVQICEVPALRDGRSLMVDANDIHLLTAPTMLRRTWLGTGYDGKIALHTGLEMKFNIFLGHPHRAVVAGWPHQQGQRSLVTACCHGWLGSFSNRR